MARCERGHVLFLCWISLLRQELLRKIVALYYVIQRVRSLVGVRLGCVLQDLFHVQNLLICRICFVGVLGACDAQLLICDLQVVPKFQDVMLHFPDRHANVLQSIMDIGHLLDWANLFEKLCDHFPGLLVDGPQLVRFRFVFVCQVVDHAQLVLGSLTNLVHDKIEVFLVLVADLL